MERPIKELTEDEVKEYRIIKAALDAGATVKKVKDGEGGIYLRGRKLITKEVMECIFNPDFKCPLCGGTLSEIRTDGKKKWRHCYSCHMEQEVQDSA